MNVSVKRFWILIGSIVALTLAPAARSTSASASADYYNRILQGTTSDSDLVNVGDMQIRAGVVRAWRDKLGGISKKSATPNASSPSGLVKWTGGKVYYVFDSAVTSAHRRQFLDAAAEWGTFANVQFLQRTTQTKYMLVQNSANAGGQSAVGMVGPAQLFLIGSWNRGTLLHELGHTLGLIHEHQRSDRDTYVNILTANVIGGATNGNFTLIPDSTNGGPYDFYSIMHYARNALSLNPATLNTIEPKPSYSAYLNIYGQQSDRPLSPGDRSNMAVLYGAGPVLTSVVTNTKDSGPGSLRAALYYAFDNPGTTITFNIPVTDPNFNGTVWNILPTDPLFAPGDNTVVNGASQPGNSNSKGPEILLSGTRMPSPEFYSPGIKLIGSGVKIRGFIISRFPSNGIRITGPAAAGNFVESCYIGTDTTGGSPAPNGDSGISIDSGASGNLIGGYTADSRNVISGSKAYGVYISDIGTNNNTIAGNYIGTRPTGASALPNAYGGVGIFEAASNNTVGGSSATARNIISGNANYGVVLGGAATKNNVVSANFIGTVFTGNTALGNGWSGVGLYGGTNGNIIGGTTVNTRNVISGNGNYGVFLSDRGTSNNTVSGNFIGTNSTGSYARPNAWSGVEIFNGATNNTIGSLINYGRNYISANSLRGIGISGTSTSGNSVINNYIGVNASGTVANPNQGPGVLLFGGTKNNVIGNTNPAGRNVISGNAGQGIVIADPATSGNTVINNFVGINSTGNSPIPNNGTGIDVFNGASGNFIGTGTSSNVISGNKNYGIALSGSGTKGNLISHNFIGLNAAGNGVIPNAFSGIALFGGASNNTIGGTGSGERNFISGNLWGGINFYDNSTIGNALYRNSIWANGGLAFNLVGGSEDIYGVTANDTGDTDFGPNNLQNYPVFTSVVSRSVTPSGTAITGTLQGLPNTTYRIETYIDNAQDPSGHGGCKTYFSTFSAKTNNSGAAPISVNYGTILAPGTFFTATATSPTGDTSEFAQNVVVTAAP